jgi:hypothetical protein
MRSPSSYVTEVAHTQAHLQTHFFSTLKNGQMCTLDQPFLTILAQLQDLCYTAPKPSVIFGFSLVVELGVPLQGKACVRVSTIVDTTPCTTLELPC